MYVHALFTEHISCKARRPVSCAHTKFRVILWCFLLAWTLFVLRHCLVGKWSSETVALIGIWPEKMIRLVGWNNGNTVGPVRKSYPKILHSLAVNFMTSSAVRQWGIFVLFPVNDERIWRVYRQWNRTIRKKRLSPLSSSCLGHLLLVSPQYKSLMLPYSISASTWNKKKQ